MSNYKGNVSYADELFENKIYPRIVKKNIKRKEREMKKYMKNLNNYKGNVSYIDELEVNGMYPNIYEKVGE